MYASKMSGQKVLTKLKRVGKEAFQFQFTSTFEYVTSTCNGTWRPTQLRVIWLRSHRRVESIPVQWIATEDRGPNGADGKAKFKPVLSVGLIVTLYKGKFADNFEGKEYKYYIQDESERGTKILASFTLDLADYANTSTHGSRNVLEMTFHSESRKVCDVMLGMTLTSQLLKQGKANDDDMQSTFSALTTDQYCIQPDSEGSGSSEGEGRRGEEEEAADADIEGRQQQRANGVHVAQCGPVQLDPVCSLATLPGSSPGENRTHCGAQRLPTITENTPPTSTPESASVLAVSPHSPYTSHPLTASRPMLTAAAQNLHTSAPYHSSSPSLSPAPSPVHSPIPSPTPSPTASPIAKRKEKTKKEKKTLKSFFRPTRRVSIKSKSPEVEQQGMPADPPPSPRPFSPPPLSPPLTLTNSANKPWVEITEMVLKLKETVQKLEDENKVIRASMEIQGWLFKRGVKGVTAHVWRRRFFRCEGSKIYYYKAVSAPKAQGYIDLDSVLGVREVCPDEQDKNCSTFLVRCEGRTFQLQAIDQPTMNKWMSAIELLVDWRKSYGEKRERDSREGLQQRETDTEIQHEDQ